MSEAITLARPYAKAAFEFAKSEAAVDKWSTQLMVAAGLAQDDQVLDFFNNPDAADEDLIQLIGGNDASEYYQNFIHMLAANDRLSLLPEVAELFQYYLELDTQALTVEVYSAVELTDAQKSAMTAALSQRTGKEITLQTHIDDDMLGGARIYCNDLVIDGTLRGKVERLKTKLVSH